MKMHLIRRKAMRFTFRFGNDAENAPCQPARPLGHVAAFDDGVYLMEMAVSVGVMVRMSRFGSVPGGGG